MKIRSKIVLCNTVLLLVSLLILLLANDNMIKNYVKVLYEPSRIKIDDNVEKTRQILEEMKQISEVNSYEAELEVLGYKLFRMENINELDSINGKTTLKNAMKSIEWSEKAESFLIDGITIVGKRIGTNVVFAMQIRDRSEMIRTNRTESELYRYLYVILSLILIVILVLISNSISKRIIRGIMKPLYELMDGAKRIESGILTQPVCYQTKDEFRAVCEAFNHMQEYLIEEKEKNARYEKVRTDMIAGISHDLRTPLTSIKGYIKGLKDGVANTPEKQQQYLETAYKKACSMDELLQRFFYYSKLETGNLPFQFINKDLAAILRVFAEEMTLELKHKNIELEIHIEPGVHLVELDEEHFIRVLANLINNAVNYANSEHLRLRIDLRSEEDKEIIIFSDNGQGVEEEQLHSMFQEFWRGDQSRSRREKEGSGLGLYIVKYIIEAHKGTIYAKNENGLKLIMELPSRKEAEHE